MAFLKHIDSHVDANPKIEMFLGGGAAILLAYDGQLATDDLDFIAAQG